MSAAVHIEKLSPEATPLRPRVKSPRSMAGQSTRRASEREFAYVRTDDLRPHPLNTKLYGSEEVDPKLLESIRQVGILEPLLIARLSFDNENFANYIVSGHRRWAAATQIASEAALKDRLRIPVRWIHQIGVRDVWDHLQVEQFIIESNHQRVKTPEQLGREFTELKRIEAELAKRRQSTSTGGNRPQLVEKIPEAGGRARDKAASAVGLSGRTAEKLAAVVRAADAGDSGARVELDALNTGESKSIDSAYRAVIQKPVACRCPDCDQPFPSRNQLRKHGQTKHNIPSTDIADFLARSKQPHFESAPSVEEPNPQPTPTATMTVKELLEWESTIDDSSVGIRQHKDRMFPNRVDVGFYRVDPATAKQIVEWFLRLKKAEQGDADDRSPQQQPLDGDSASRRKV